MTDVQQTKAHLIVTSNPGCLLQMKQAILRAGMPDQMEAVHIMDLQAYFNEFCYLLNGKLQKASIFEGLADLCMSSQRITYAALTRW